MINKSVKASKGGISRRKLLKTGSTAMVFASLGPVTSKIAHAGVLRSATMDGEREEDTVAQVLAFWLAVTNNNDAFKIPLDPAQIEKATGLKSSRRGDAVDTAIRHVNGNPNTYGSLRAEFKKLTAIFSYSPGQCPKNPTTLKKLADVNPNG